MENLIQIGYPNDLKYIITLNNNQVQVKQGEESKDLPILIKDLHSKFENLNQILNKAYEEDQLMTFLNRWQFYVINKYIKKKKKYW